DRPLHDRHLHTDALGALHLETRIDLQGQSVRLIAVHPKPPMAVRKFRARDRLLRELGQSSSQALIVAGDLNATPWSSALYTAQRHRLLRITGSAPTYPSDGAGLIGIGIDHVLVSSQLAGTFRQRGPNIGSDHLPVRAGLSWHAAPGRSAAAPPSALP
ncbi:MAG: endonuclease/exonuclease/phosphatase family protein, partial [Stenotrophomonas sp.]